MKYLSLLIVVVALFSCEKKEVPLPLEEEHLSKILADVHVAEAAAQNITGPAKDSMLDIYYDQIYKINKIEKAEFMESMEILRNDPIRLERIYSRTMDILSTDPEE